MWCEIPNCFLRVRILKSLLIEQEIVTEKSDFVCLTGYREKTRPNRGTYSRFKIKTQHAPPRRQKPFPFYPKVGKVGLFKSLVKETLTYNLKLLKKEYRSALLSRPCIYGVFSGPVGGFAPRRELCTGCLRCVQEFPEFCTVERNPEFNKFADSYWQAKDPSKESTSPYLLVINEAENGKIPVKGMGYKGSFADEGWDTIWTDMSEIVRPTRDGIYGREYISTETVIGGRVLMPNFDMLAHNHVRPHLNLSLPIIFDHLPSSISSKVVLESIAKASAEAGTLFSASPGQVKHLREDLLKHQILHAESFDDLQDLWTEAIEIDLGKMLGFNPFEDEVAHVYTDEKWSEALEIISRVRDITEGKILIVKLPLTESAGSKVTEMLQMIDVDSVHLYADYHGMTFAQQFEFKEFIKDSLRRVHETLVKDNVRDRITLIVSGGVILAEHVPKAIICGADAVAINTTALVALQMKFKGECRTPYDGGIHLDGFNTKWGQQRLVNLLAAWHYQLLEVLSAMGMRDVRRLRGDVGRAIFKEEIEQEAFGEIKGFPAKGGDFY